MVLTLIHVTARIKVSAAPLVRASQPLALVHLSTRRPEGAKALLLVSLPLTLIAITRRIRRTALALAFPEPPIALIFVTAGVSCVAVPVTLVRLPQALIPLAGGILARPLPVPPILLPFAHIHIPICIRRLAIALCQAVSTLLTFVILSHLLWWFTNSLGSTGSCKARRLFSLPALPFRCRRICRRCRCTCKRLAYCCLRVTAAVDQVLRNMLQRLARTTAGRVHGRREHVGENGKLLLQDGT
mmetsp:Transcript_43478/g.87005  ORF Transcript_43478/g.87005 Transcript_43478/m.87005 type:complete len:243 (+) Transcript_43478:842-1570(+)